MRGIVEIAGGALKQVRHAVDKNLNKPHESQSRRALGTLAQFCNHPVERGQLCKPHRQENIFGEHETGRQYGPWLVFVCEDQRCGQIQRVALDAQPARRFDFGEFVLGRHA